MIEQNRKRVLRLTAFGGMLGLHQFYKRRFLLGTVYLFSGGMLLIGWTLDTASAFRAYSLSKSAGWIRRENGEDQWGWLD